MNTVITIKTVGSLYHFKRDEQPLNNNNVFDMTAGNSSSLKYKSSLLTGLTTEDGGAGADAYRIFKNAQMLVSLFYDSSFFRSAELIFLNTKINLELS